jgi:CheY-like chemotaxis protein
MEVFHCQQNARASFARPDFAHRQDLFQRCGRLLNPVQRVYNAHFSPLNQWNLPVPSAARVLVVDDNADAAGMLGMLLKSSGHIAQIANSGAAAIAAFPEFRPHVVLLDLGMPGMDGFEVCRSLRAFPDSESVLIAIVSGYVQDEQKVKAMEAGANYYFMKPIETAKVLELVALQASS